MLCHVFEKRQTVASIQPGEIHYSANLGTLGWPPATL